jgi:hypothetical protein
MPITLTGENGPLLRDKRTDIVLRKLTVLQLTNFARQLGIASQLNCSGSEKTIIVQAAARDFTATSNRI